MLAAVCADHGEKQVTGWRDIRANVQLLPNRNLSDKEGTSYDRQHLLNPEYAAHPGDLTSSGPLEKRAKVAVARKLAVILHRMWIDGSTFRWSKTKSAHS
jgi:hypothetical protein